MKARSSDNKARKDSGQERSVAEWTTMALSVLLVAGLMAAVAYPSLRAAPAPVSIEVKMEVERIRESGDEWYVPVRIRNVGEEAAEAARVTLETSGRDAQSVEVEIDFLAGGEEVEAVAVFSRDPRKADMSASATSYLQP